MGGFVLIWCLNSKKKDRVRSRDEMLKVEEQKGKGGKMY